MSNTQKQRSTPLAPTIKPQSMGNDGAALSEQRSEIDRLFAIAAQSFENLSQGDSESFLRRSRQTGGQ